MLTSTLPTITWDSNGVSPDHWYIEVKEAGQSANLYDNGNIASSATSHTVSGLPTDGRDLTVRLWAEINGNWSANDFPYVSLGGASGGGGSGQMNSPTPSSTLTGTSVTFNWTDGSSGGNGGGGSSSSSSSTTTFLYDGDGGRVKKTVDDGSLTVETIYIGKLYVCTVTVSPSCAKMIFSGSQRIAMKQVDNGSTSYFHPDHLGSTSVLTDSSGVSEQDVAYYPYGEERINTSTATPAVDIAYKYTGKEQDSSTGLYFYEARYYDPVLGRFITPDTIVPEPGNPQEFNRYTYVENNPIKYIDPDGAAAILAPWLAARFINGIIGAFSGGSAAYTAAIAGNAGSASIFGSTLAGGATGFVIGAAVNPQAAISAGTFSASATTAAIAYASDVFGQIIGDSPTGLDLIGQPVFSAASAPLATFTGAAAAARLFARSSSALFTLGANGTASGLLVPQVPNLFSGVVGAGLFGGPLQGLGTAAGSYIPSPRFDFSLNGVTIGTSHGFGIPTNIRFGDLFSQSPTSNVPVATTLGGSSETAGAPLYQNLTVNFSNTIGNNFSQGDPTGLYGGDLSSPLLSLPDLGSTIRPSTGNFNPFNIGNPFGGGGPGGSRIGGGGGF